MQLCLRASNSFNCGNSTAVHRNDRSQASVYRIMSVVNSTSTELLYKVKSIKLKYLELNNKDSCGTIPPNIAYNNLTTQKQNLLKPGFFASIMEDISLQFYHKKTNLNLDRPLLLQKSLHSMQADDPPSLQAFPGCGTLTLSRICKSQM